MIDYGSAAGKTAATTAEGVQTRFIIAGDGAEILDDGDDEDVGEVETDLRRGRRREGV